MGSGRVGEGLCGRHGARVRPGSSEAIGFECVENACNERFDWKGRVEVEHGGAGWFAGGAGVGVGWFERLELRVDEARGHEVRAASAAVADASGGRVAVDPEVNDQPTGVLVVDEPLAVSAFECGAGEDDAGAVGLGVSVGAVAGGLLDFGGDAVEPEASVVVVERFPLAHFVNVGGRMEVVGFDQPPASRWDVVG